MGFRVCPETSVSNWHYLLRKNPEERNSHLLPVGSLKLRIMYTYVKISDLQAQIWTRGLPNKKLLISILSVITAAFGRPLEGLNIAVLGVVAACFCSSVSVFQCQSLSPFSKEVLISFYQNEWRDVPQSLIWQSKTSDNLDRVAPTLI